MNGFEHDKKLFQFGHSFRHEMDRFKVIMSIDAEKGKELFQCGTELVALASSGQFRKFCSKCCEAIHEKVDFPAIYFISKCLEASLLSQHLMISAFILDNGYPLNDSTLPNVLTTLVKAETSDEQCRHLVEFLATKKYDFNSQVRVGFV